LSDHDHFGGDWSEDAIESVVLIQEAIMGQIFDIPQYADI
jgi:hypothetical protein